MTYSINQKNEPLLTHCITVLLSS